MKMNKYVEERLLHLVGLLDYAGKNFHLLVFGVFSGFYCYMMHIHKGLSQC